MFTISYIAPLIDLPIKGKINKWKSLLNVFMIQPVLYTHSPLGKCLCTLVNGD